MPLLKLMTQRVKPRCQLKCEESGWGTEGAQGRAGPGLSWMKGLRGERLVLTDDCVTAEWAV